MILFHETNIQISPCIASKARFALLLKNESPTTIKRCSLAYWISTINTLCLINNINSGTRRQRAINRYDELINN
jgi:hypothetical protein